MNEKKKQEIPIPFSLDDFYTTQEQRDEDSKEKIEDVDISLIDNFKNHPFRVVDNDELKSLKNSIKVNGVLSPAIIRKKDDGRYEMISGHRRKFASEQLGLNTIPCVVKDLTDDEAIIFMVDSNLQREKLLPSEKAFAYKMKYDAIKHQGRALGPLDQKDNNSGPLDRKWSAEIIGDEVGKSEKTIRRYIRLTYLIPELLNMVDNSELKETPAIAIRPAVELSFLNKEDQMMLANYIELYLVTPSLSQAIELKQLSQKGLLSEETLDNRLSESKPNQIPKFKIHEDKLYNVIPKNISRDKVEEFVIKACEYYSKILRQRERNDR